VHEVGFSWTTGLALMPKRLRKQVGKTTFIAVAGVVETLVSGNDTRYPLSAESHVTLRTAISSARQYVAFILPLFYEPGALTRMCNTRKHIDNAYSDHGQSLIESRDFPHFRRLWEDIRSEKRRFRHITKAIRSNKQWETAVIHRLVENGTGDSIRRKRVVLDPTNPDEYRNRFEYHVMVSDSCHVVGGSDTDVRLHLFVCGTLCDISDDEIRLQLDNCTGKSTLSQNWFLGTHVVNLHRIVPWANWTERVNEDLLSTLVACRHIQRSKDREDAVVKKDDRARMYKLSFHCDHQGYLRAPHNLDSRLDESEKFDLMRAHDHIMDGVALV
jgi:hypothetical protein